MREIVLDCETTGLSHADGHRIVELACLELINAIPTGKSWRWLVNPERDIPADATKIHGITAEMLRDKPTFSAVAGEINAVIEESRLVIHNAPFDVGFLNSEMARINLPPIGMDRVRCTLQLARRKHPGARNTLDALCERYNISTARRLKHSALIDCELLAEVYVSLTGAKQAALELTEAPGAEAERIVALRRPHPLSARITEEEKAAHAAFVASLGAKAIWLRFAA